MLSGNRGTTRCHWNSIERFALRPNIQLYAARSTAAPTAGRLVNYLDLTLCGEPLRTTRERPFGPSPGFGNTGGSEGRGDG